MKPSIRPSVPGCSAGGAEAFLILHCRTRHGIPARPWPLCIESGHGRKSQVSSPSCQKPNSENAADGTASPLMILLLPGLSPAEDQQTAHCIGGGNNDIDEPGHEGLLAPDRERRQADAEQEDEGAERNCEDRRKTSAG